jgi:sulfur-carrier protein
VIRVRLPYHLRQLASVGAEVQLELQGSVTLGTVFDRLEANYPVLRGTIRDSVTLQRRPMLRWFAAEQDLSFVPQDEPLLEVVASGSEPLLVIGAIAGG